MDKIVTIRTYNDYFSANAMKEVLLESGIQCNVLNENSGTVLPSIMVGGIKLQVLESDRERATAIIHDLEKEADDQQDSDAFWTEDKSAFDPNNRICVNCGSKNTTINDATRKTFFGKILFKKYPKLFEKEQWHCFHCGIDF